VLAQELEQVRGWHLDQDLLEEAAVAKPLAPDWNAR